MVEFQIHSYNTFWDMNFYQVWQTDRLTDGQTGRKRCIRAHRAICTGGLKKWTLHVNWYFVPQKALSFSHGEVNFSDKSYFEPTYTTYTENTSYPNPLIAGPNASKISQFLFWSVIIYFLCWNSFLQRRRRKWYMGRANLSQFRVKKWIFPIKSHWKSRNSDFFHKTLT